LNESSHEKLAGRYSVVVTDDQKVYFCRSELNPTDYIIWVRIADKDAPTCF
jgi:hypothetical protein